MTNQVLPQYSKTIPKESSKRIIAKIFTCIYICAYIILAVMTSRYIKVLDHQIDDYEKIIKTNCISWSGDINYPICSSGELLCCNDIGYEARDNQIKINDKSTGLIVMLFLLCVCVMPPLIIGSFKLYKIRK